MERSLKTDTNKNKEFHREISENSSSRAVDIDNTESNKQLDKYSLDKITPEIDILIQSKQEAVYTRAKWNSRRDFYLSCAGGFIGLGNVWRFPYLCYENGGAVFFIPYLIFLVLVGIPIFFLEVSVGQWTSEGGITAWKLMAPIASGIGYGSIALTIILNTYYIVVLGWSLYYMVVSWATPTYLNQIWNLCNNTWNTPHCVTFEHKAERLNVPDVTKETLRNLTTPIEEYWEHSVLKMSDEMTFETLTDINWTLYSSVVAAWIVCYFCVWKSLKWTGNVVCFTATFPIVMLLVLLVRGVTLPGAWTGLSFYLIPKAKDWGNLLAIKIWLDAGTQVLYSYALCKGALMSLGSYNKFRTNCYKDVFILSCCNSGVSFISGFAIFSVLGFMAERFNTTVDLVAKSGPGLAFIAFPQAILQMPGKEFQPYWAVAFFFMIFLLGLDSQFVGLEAVATSFIDMFPALRKPGRRELFILGIVIFSLILALPMCGSGGAYLFKLYDYYGASGFCLLWLSACQTLTISYIYGSKKMWRNTRALLGFYPSKYCLICWKYITPICCLILTVLKIIMFKPLKYERPIQNFVYSKKQESLGWMLSSISILPVLVVFIYKSIFDKNGKLCLREHQIYENIREKCKAKDQNIENIVYTLGRSPDDLRFVLEPAMESVSSSNSSINETKMDKYDLEVKYEPGKE